MRTIRYTITLYILLLLTLKSNGQSTTLPESLRSELSNDTTVLNFQHDIFYTKKGIKGNEGWFYYSYYNPHIDGKKKESPVLHRIGHWKNYRKKECYNRKVERCRKTRKRCGRFMEMSVRKTSRPTLKDTGLRRWNWERVMPW